MAVTTKLGLQVESRTAGTGISLLTAETVRSLMLDKRKASSLVLPVPITSLHTATQHALHHFMVCTSTTTRLAQNRMSLLSCKSCYLPSCSS